MSEGQTFSFNTKLLYLFSNQPSGMSGGSGALAQWPVGKGGEPDAERVTNHLTQSAAKDDQWKSRSVEIPHV